MVILNHLTYYYYEMLSNGDQQLCEMFCPTLNISGFNTLKLNIPL